MRGRTRAHADGGRCVDGDDDCRHGPTAGERVGTWIVVSGQRRCVSREIGHLSELPLVATARGQVAACQMALYSRNVLVAEMRCSEGSATCTTRRRAVRAAERQHISRLSPGLPAGEQRGVETHGAVMCCALILQRGAACCSVTDDRGTSYAVGATHGASPPRRLEIRVT